jgi:hypothetical protein
MLKGIGLEYDLIERVRNERTTIAYIEPLLLTDPQTRRVRGPQCLHYGCIANARIPTPLSPRPPAPT